MSCASMSPGHGTSWFRPGKGLAARSLQGESSEDTFDVGGSGSIKMT